MNNFPKHWLYPESLQNAAQIQREIHKLVVTSDQLNNISYIGGMDVSHNPRHPLLYATVVILDTNLQCVASEHAASMQKFPYVSGFLGFREAPVLIEAWQKLTQKPDLLLVDGHGISHPRGLGIASHIGVLLDQPTIGVAKTILVGKPETELGPEAGAHVPLIWKNKIIGMVVRTKQRCRPLIISTGHRVSLDTALSLVLQYTRGYRLPEPTRQAHLEANRYRCMSKQSSLLI